MTEVNKFNRGCGSVKDFFKNLFTCNYKPINKRDSKNTTEDFKWVG